MSLARVNETQSSSAARAGDELFASHYRALNADLSSRAYRLTGNRAAVEDIVADAMELVWKRWRTLGGDSGRPVSLTELRKFAFGVVRNKAHEYWRASGRTCSLEGIDPESEVLARFGDPSLDLEVAETLRVIQSLPPQQRESLGRRVVGFRDSEIAENLGIGEGTVRNHLAGARRKVSSYLANPENWGKLLAFVLIAISVLMVTVPAVREIVEYWLRHFRNVIHFPRYCRRR